MIKSKIRPATKEDFVEFYGGQLQYSTKAWAGEYYGELVVMTGVMYAPECALLFSDIKEGTEFPKMTVWRAVKEFMSLVQGLEIPLVAVCYGDFMNSSKMLEKFGFVKHMDTEEGEVYKWAQ